MPTIADRINAAVDLLEAGVGMDNSSIDTNVVWYGAKGDGTTDDAAAFAAAQTAAGPGGTVRFPPGRTYKMVGSVAITVDYLTIVGHGATLKGADQNDFGRLSLTARKGVKILGLTFDGLYTSSGTGIDAFQVFLSACEDVTIRDCTFTKTSKVGLTLSGACKRTKVEACRFSQCFLGIFSDNDGSNQPLRTTVSDCSFWSGIGGVGTAFSGAIKFSGTGTEFAYAGHVIKGNDIESPGQMGIELQTQVNDCTITGNTIKTCGFGISISGCSRTTITGNTINDMDTYGIEVASGSSNTSCVGNNLLNCSKGVEVNGASTFITVQGGTIYGGTACVNAEDFSHLLVQGVQMRWDYGLAVNLKDGSNAVITGNEMQGTSHSYTVFGIDSTDTDVSNVTISNNLITAVGGAMSGSAISLYAVANHITDVKIHGNHLRCQCPAWSITDSGTTSNATRLLRIRCFDNVGNGTSDSPQYNFNLGTHSISSAMTWFFNYWHLERSIILADVSGGAFTTSLPDPTGMCGYEVTVKKSDSSGNLVTVSTPSGTINGASTYTGLTAQNKFATFRCDGTNWHVVAAG